MYQCISATNILPDIGFSAVGQAAQVVISVAAEITLHPVPEKLQSAAAQGENTKTVPLYTVYRLNLDTPRLS